METTTANSPYQFTLPGHANASGSLSFWENSSLFPEGIQRCFWISKVKEGETRGNHAHWQEAQVIVAMAGTIELELTNVLGQIFHFKLDSPEKGVFIPPLTWLVARFSPEAVLMGMSDRVFSEEDYIRDQNYFAELQKRYK
ncbi:sugar 3,4-ketoisomerase [Algoriphagus halophytocola]|uniref:FdtA/QdtA family cupin domain-containing protein n=1 Tax=Algoriphagus halophytocola TaxID=2991499 RepID=A0ABY6MKK8_9BACT|nr:FdtA/QdtA family cupin domain-containing protein [Algoriphagus sp. TR-M5]UZD24291.1 FdtA/QdtA family cupin domain-containing protein [Algoriphagus sp. TR-M5]